MSNKIVESTIYWVIAKIQGLKKNFKVFKAQYIPRTCNECAHSLAIEKS